MDKTPENDDLKESTMLDAASTTAEIISDTASGIPAPIKKNLFKAFAQLCTAAVDIPVAHLEGKAAEIRAESNSRVKIIETSSDQISNKMDVDPQYAQVAVQKYGQRIIREQINLDDTVRIAAEEIKRKPLPSPADEDQVEVEDISDDWLNTFEREVSTKNSNEMKLLFGKILAGEIQKPNSFSIKTLKTLSQLDQKIAKIFLTLCSLCTQAKFGNSVLSAMVNSLGKNAGANGLKEYSISFTDLTLLIEYGLIQSELHITGTFDFFIDGSPHSKSLAFPLTIQGKNYKLYPKPERDMDERLKLSGLSLSSTGKELLTVIDPPACDKYIQGLKEYFDKIHLSMVELE